MEWASKVKWDGWSEMRWWDGKNVRNMVNDIGDSYRLEKSSPSIKTTYFMLPCPSMSKNSSRSKENATLSSQFFLRTGPFVIVS